jgi:mitochondrial fission protein ELM1
MNAATPLVWALLGARRGDNNQVLALAEALGIPFEIKYLSYARIGGYDFGRIRPGQLGATLVSLDGRSKAQIKPPWPDLVIGVGRRSVPVARYIRKKSGGRAKLVRIGNPRMDPREFDLVITTPQYDVPPCENVLTLPIAMSRFHGRAEIGPAEKSWLEALPRPHLLLAIGGTTKDVELQPTQVAAAMNKLAERANARGGTLLIEPSPRTDRELLGSIGQSGVLVPDDGPSFAALLDDADEIFVTADSVSMLSEAIATGKPVGMIPARLTKAGLRGLGEARRGMFDFRSPKRDPRIFWTELEELKLVGTVEEPRSSAVEDPVATAARAVRALLAGAR